MAGVLGLRRSCGTCPAGRRVATLSRDARLEPGNAEIKTQCLTAWRYPNRMYLNETEKYITERMAGVLGFEPRNAEIKTQCLTAWRYPNYANRD